MTPLSARVAVVLYRPDPAQVRRLLDSLDRALTAAHDAGAVSTAVVRLGDCTPVDPPTAVIKKKPDVDGLEDARFLLDHAEGGVLRVAEGPGERWPVRHDVFGRNLWHSGGVNRLLNGLTEDVALLVNPDVVVAPDAVLHLLRAVADDDVAIADARQVPLEHPKPYDAATGETPWASMATCAIRRTAWEAVGPLDEDLFPMHGNDVDFSWRARLAGWRVRHAPAARVFHDKRLAPGGTVVPSEVEEEHGARAALLLAFRYSRPDVVERHFAFLESGTAAQRRGAAYVRDRLAHGPLPELLDPGHDVAEFVDGSFAAHRF